MVSMTQLRTKYINVCAILFVLGIYDLRLLGIRELELGRVLDE